MSVIKSLLDVDHSRLGLEFSFGFSLWGRELWDDSNLVPLIWEAQNVMTVGFYANNTWAMASDEKN